jgi:hypothetical protein
MNEHPRSDVAFTPVVKEIQRQRGSRPTFTPEGLRTWGDGRTVILGTTGYIELRKYIDVARDSGGDQLFLVTAEGERNLSLAGKVGFPFFGQLILNCLNRTENAMSQRHAFKAAELCLRAQAQARYLA